MLLRFFSFHDSFFFLNNFGSVPQICFFSIKLNKIDMLMRLLSGVPLLNLISLAPREVSVSLTAPHHLYSLSCRIIGIS